MPKVESRRNGYGGHFVLYLWRKVVAHRVHSPQTAHFLGTPSASQHVEELVLRGEGRCRDSG